MQDDLSGQNLTPSAATFGKMAEGDGQSVLDTILTPTKSPAKKQTDSKHMTVQKFISEKHIQIKQTFLSGSSSKLAVISDSLEVVLKVLGLSPKLKDLTLQQLFDISSKIVDYSEDQLLGAVGGAFGDDEFGKHNPYAGVNMFDMTNEQIVLDIDDGDSQSDEDDSSDIDTYQNAADARLSQGTRAGQHRESQQTSSKHLDGAVQTGSNEPLDYSEEFERNYRKSKKLFKKIHKKTQEMRLESMKYIINTLKILILFLRIAEKLYYNLPEKQPNSDKFNSFIMNLDKRLRITGFVMIQKINDDEKINRIARQTLDYQILCQDIEKNRKHTNQNDRSPGEGALILEEMMEKKGRKDQAHFEDARHTFDQFGSMISLVDSLLYNHFSLAELCKLKIDFLNLLHTKKVLLWPQMNQMTKVELVRFESQIQKNLILDEYVQDVQNTALYLVSQGKLQNSWLQDPVKMYFELSVKDLILSNRITGPALAEDMNVSKVLHKFFSSQVHIKEQLLKHKLTCPYEDQDLIKRGEEEMKREEIDNDQFSHRSMFNTSYQPQSRDAPQSSKSHQRTPNEGTPRSFRNTSNPNPAFLHVVRSDDTGMGGILQYDSAASLSRQSMPIATERSQPASLKKDNYPVCNEKVQVDLFIQSVSQMLFQNNLPQVITTSLKQQLLTFVGVEPPQFTNAYFVSAPGTALNMRRNFKFNQTFLEKMGEAKFQQDMGRLGLDLAEADIIGMSAYCSSYENPIPQTGKSRFEGMEGISEDPEPETNINSPSGERESQFSSEENKYQPISIQNNNLRPADTDGRGSSMKARNKLDLAFKKGRGAAHQSGENPLNRFKSGDSQKIFPNSQQHGRDKQRDEQQQEGSAAGSLSLSIQDFILLTDFVPLPELMLVLSKGRIDTDEAQNENQFAKDEALLNLSKIEHILSKLGQNELELHHDKRNEQTFLERLTSQFTYEMNSFGMKRDEVQKMLTSTGQGFLDQDLFIIILLCGLYETRSVSLINGKGGAVTSKGFQHAENKKMLLKVEFDQVIEEYPSAVGDAVQPQKQSNSNQGPHSAEQSAGHSSLYDSQNQATGRQRPDYLDYDPGRNPRRKEIQFSSASKVVMLTKSYMSGQTLNAGTFKQLQIQSNPKTSNEKRDESDVVDGKSPPNIKQTQNNMMYLFNQLMVHQRLERMKFAQIAVNNAHNMEVNYKRSFEVYREFIVQFLEHMETLQPQPNPCLPLMAAKPPEEQPEEQWGRSTIFDFTLLSKVWRQRNFIHSNKQYQLEYEFTKPIVLENFNRKVEIQPIFEDFEHHWGKFAQLQIDSQIQIKNQIKMLESDHLNNEQRILLIKLHNETRKDRIQLEQDKEDQKNSAQQKPITGYSSQIQSPPNSSFGLSDHTQAPYNVQKFKSALPKPGTTGITPIGKDFKTQNDNILSHTTKLKSTGHPNSPSTAQVSYTQAKNDGQGDQSIVDHDEFQSDYKNRRAAANEHVNTVGVQYVDAASVTPDEKQKMQTSAIYRRKIGDQLRKTLVDQMIHKRIFIDYAVQRWYQKICFLSTNNSKEKMLSSRLNKIEELLYACDLQLLKQRQILVKMLKAVENGMEENESAIKGQLQQIAILEMERGKDEDEMLDQTLKAVEMINISDLSVEKDKLDEECKLLLARKAELEKIEEDFHKERVKERQKERQKREARKFPRATKGKEATDNSQGSQAALNRQSASLLPSPKNSAIEPPESTR